MNSNLLFGNTFALSGLVIILVGFVLLAIAIIIIVVVAKSLNNRKTYSDDMREITRKPDSSKSAALAILDERYAKGEINDEEYKAKKENLK
jgi:uncharacterized membrane protein